MKNLWAILALAFMAWLVWKYWPQPQSQSPTLNASVQDSGDAPTDKVLVPVVTTYIGEILQMFGATFKVTGYDSQGRPVLDQVAQ